jgi:dethiobiotin synthetase
VRSLVKRTDTVFHPEQFRFKEPAAPLQASRSEGVFLSLDMIELPKQNSRPLIVELSGGLMVPINEKQLLCEAFFKKGFEWVIVSQNYLGSINHTLLSVDFLRQSGEPIKGIFFNGDALPGAEEFILNYTQLPCLGRLRNAH